MTEHLTLISHNLCPYVQRAAIALLEKDVAFERITIDLSNKPDWFLAISPTGKVPLLRVARDDGLMAVIFESTVICEYLEETQGEPKLHPSDLRWLRLSEQLFQRISGAPASFKLPQRSAEAG